MDDQIAWRRIITPVDITFRQLHAILQVAFDWKDCHLYNFNIFDEEGKCVLKIISEYEKKYESFQDSQILLDSQANLSKYIKQKYRIVYCYDYGDNWEHEITIQGVNTEYDKNYPICLMGEGNAPPEDVGGIYGYKEFLKVKADSNHSEYANMQQWVKCQWYKDFNVDAVNRRLENVLRI